MERVVVQAVAQHLCIDVCPASTCVFEFLYNERGAAFAHNESISQGVEWATCKNGVAGPSAHCLDDIESSNCYGGKRRLGTACHDDICKIIADVSQCLAHGYRATGAAV